MSASFRRQLLEDIRQGNVERIAHVAATTPSEFNVKHVNEALGQPKVLDVLLGLCKSKIKYSDDDLLEWHYDLVEQQNLASLQVLLNARLNFSTGKRDRLFDVLSYAIGYGTDDITNVLVDAFQSDDCPAFLWGKPLRMAVENQKKDLVNKILQLDVDWTIAMSAVIETGDDELFERLLSRWNEQDYQQDQNLELLFDWLKDTAIYGRFEMTLKLLDRLASSPERADGVYTACFRGLRDEGDAKTIRLLLTHLSPNTDHHLACSALEYHSDKTLFHDILPHTELTEESCFLMLESACREGQGSACRALLEEYFPSSDEMKTLLRLAAPGNHVEVIDALIQSREWDEVRWAVEEVAEQVQSVLAKEGKVSYLNAVLERGHLHEQVGGVQDQNVAPRKKM